MASALKKRHSNEVTLKEAINRLLEVYKLDRGVDEAAVIASWEELMGGPIARRTRNIFFRNGKLIIQLDSSTLRHELNLGREKLMTLLNEKAGKEVVREIEIR